MSKARDGVACQIVMLPPALVRAEMLAGQITDGSLGQVLTLLSEAAPPATAR
jgi:hypothetical protein